jgi:hypothetical protein
MEWMSVGYQIWPLRYWIWTPGGFAHFLGHWMQEFEDPVEDVHASTPPAHKDENMVIFSHIDGLMKVPFDMVDEPIDTFIQTGRCRWDLGCLNFDRDPIYDIEGSSQAEGVSFSEDWSSCMYDSDIWQPGDDIVTDFSTP